MTSGTKKHLFIISGGAGKGVMATAVVASLKEACLEDKIIVATAHPAVWLNNPDVSEVVDLQSNPKLFEKYAKDTNCKIYSQEVYLSDDFVNRRTHLIEAWCNVYKIPYKGALPKLYYTEKEKELIRKKLPDNKPLFLIQTSGGAPNQQYPISWMRDMPLPLAQKSVDHMNSQGFKTIHIRRKDQYAIENAEWIDMNMREMMGSIMFSERRLFIDSLAQHAAAALSMPSVVTWAGNRPEVFGYEMHKNILPSIDDEFRHHIDSFFDKYDITGSLHECPYNTNEIYDFNEIIEKLEK